MSVVSVLNVAVHNNPAPFTAPYEFEITFECLEPLQKGSLFPCFSRLERRLPSSRSRMETYLRGLCNLVYSSFHLRWPNLRLILLALAPNTTKSSTPSSSVLYLSEPTNSSSRPTLPISLASPVLKSLVSPSSSLLAAMTDASSSASATTLTTSTQTRP